MRAAAQAGLLLAAVALAGAAAAPAAGADSSTGPEGLRGLLGVRSGDTAGRGVLEAGFFSSLHALDDTTGSSHVVSITHLQVGYCASGPLELGLVLPVRGRFVQRSDRSRVDATRRLGFGDLTASAKLQLPVPGRRVRLGILGSGSFPTGSRSRGMSTESTDLELGGALTLDLGQLQRFPAMRLHANGSYRWNRNEIEGFGLAPLEAVRSGSFWPPAYAAVPPGQGIETNDQILWRFGVEFATRALDLFTEFAYDGSPHLDGLRWRDHPVRLTPGALVKFRNGLNLKGAVDLSLQRDTPPAAVPELPDWRFHLGLTYRRTLTLGDGDQDGIPDERDRCPGEAEDFDGFQDEDGCPDLDNDADGVPDRDDLAPGLPEDRDGFEDQDGRPDMDNDGDGIGDEDDACPNEPEDYDGEADTDGCPDTAEQQGATPPKQ